MRCRKCGTIVEIPHGDTESSKLNEKLEEEAIVTEAKRIVAERIAKAYRTVRLGLSLLYWGLVLQVLSVVAVVVSATVAGFTLSPDATRMALIMASILPVAFVVALAMGLVGKFFCLAVPEETGGKQVIYASVSLDVIATLVYVIPALWSLTGQSFEEPPDEFDFAVFVAIFGEMGLLAPLLAVTAFVLFLVFLRKLALYLKQPELAVEAANVLRIGIGMVLVDIGGAVFPSLAWMMLWPNLLLVLIGLIFYANLLAGIKRVLGHGNVAS